MQIRSLNYKSFSDFDLADLSSVYDGLHPGEIRE